MKFVIFLLFFLPCSLSSFTFIHIGDWGGQDAYPYTTVGQVDIAKQLSRLSNSVDLILSVGDNFYYNGVKSVDDPRFVQTFENVFNTGNTPWYLIAGNHDHGGNVSAQIEYSQKSKKPWIFPAEYYTFSQYFSNVSVLFIMTDSFLLENGDSEQVIWIENELKNSSQYDWIFVVGHYPVWSVSSHGSQPFLQNLLLPLLDKYRVDAYLSGHDHNIQHIKLVNSSVTYIVSGAGHTLEYNLDHISSVPPEALRFFLPSSYTPIATSAFCIITIHDTFLATISVIDSFGEEVYQTKLHADI